MYTVTKNNKTQQLASDIHLSAFLNAGWALVGDQTAGSPEDSRGREPNADDLAEIAALKVEADALELRYPHNVSAAKLRERIEEHKSNTQ